MGEEMNDENEPTWRETAITMILSASMMGLIAAMVFALAQPAEAGESWAAQWADGYATGYCWTRNPCDYIPPVQIPYPEDGQSDGYVAGLKRGLEDGRQEL